MRRHLLVGRFGSNDTVNIHRDFDENLTIIELLDKYNKIDYGIDNVISSMVQLNLKPNEVSIDLLIVAALIHAADTRLSRATESQDGWSREIRLDIPVSDPDLWSNTSTIIKKLLDFLTGDRWEIGFRPRNKENSVKKLGQNSLLSAPYEKISLFSGGLDSLIGAINILKSGESTLLVGHAGDPLVSKSQDDCYTMLKNTYTNSKFNFLRLWMLFQNNLVNSVKSESTTRGRSFLFFSLGVAAGIGLGKKFSLIVPENGFIALNIPLDSLRLGALSTHTTHPFYISLWNKLLEALEIDGELVNPYWNQTKRDMVKQCKDYDLLKNLIPKSLSCSSPSKGRWNHKKLGHCGYCLPCLIRRASLLDDDPTDYLLSELHGKTINTRKAEGQQIRSLQYAISRQIKNPDLHKLLIHKPGSLMDFPDRIDTYAEVYRRGLDEVCELLAGVKTKPL